MAKEKRPKYTVLRRYYIIHPNTAKKVEFELQVSTREEEETSPTVLDDRIEKGFRDMLAEYLLRMRLPPTTRVEEVP